MSPENKKQPKIRELTFQVGEDLDADDPEFLTGFTEFLRQKGYDPQQLVFSGFDATPLTQGKPLERKRGMFAMNLAGWKSTYEGGIAPNNPAHYAERHIDKGVPAIGLYDKNQLAEAYSHDIVEPPETMRLNEEEGRKLFLGGQPVGGWDVKAEDENSHFSEPRFEEIVDERADFTNVDVGEHLAVLPNETQIIEGVVHVDYPNGSPSDALVGIVYLKHQ